jgi:hypothetical protein
MGLSRDAISHKAAGIDKVRQAVPSLFSPWNPTSHVAPPNQRHSVRIQTDRPRDSFVPIGSAQRAVFCVLAVPNPVHWVYGGTTPPQRHRALDGAIRPKVGATTTPGLWGGGMVA